MHTRLIDAIRRLFRRQPAVRVGPSVTVDWRESTRRVLEERGQAMADGLAAHERLMMAANVPDIHEIVEEVVNREGWTIGGVPLSGPVEPLFFNLAGNPWQAVVIEGMPAVSGDTGYDAWMAEHEQGKKALDLWRRFFDEGIEPWKEDMYDRDCCLFCGEYELTPHAPDCVYVQAKALFPVEKEAGDK